MDKVDPTQRLTHVAVAAKISDADYLGWRTEREKDANPNSITPRAALRLDAARIVEDLIVSLRRQWR